MASRNDITGDSIQTKGVSDAYRDNYDLIWGKKAKMTPRVDKKDDGDDFGSCGCGRSPTGKCIGWHGLTEEKYRVKLEEYNKSKESK